VADADPAEERGGEGFVVDEDIASRGAVECELVVEKELSGSTVEIGIK